MHHRHPTRLAGCCTLLCLALSSPALKADGGFPDAWSQPPRTASQAGIHHFSQSPYLADRDLPDVRKRLPDDPVVVEPYERVGRYGGTARIEELDWWLLNPKESLATIGADLQSILPNLAQWWSYSDDGRRLTVKLRAGIKWSDGVPLTVDDYVFTFNELELNPAYNPVPPTVIRGARLVKIDDLTMRYEFPEPNPLFVNFLAQAGDFLLVPKHYYQRFHPNYNDPAELEARIRGMGYISWGAFILACRRNVAPESAEVPTLWAFRPVERTPTLVTYERNPYYFKVDPQGRQLPYIDRIEAEVISDSQVVAAKAASGQLDFAGYSLRTQDIPLLKLGERTGVVRVLIWHRLHGSDVAIEFNFNQGDDRLRALFQDVRFRRALSLAIDRDEINQVVYFGRGTPRQVTVLPDSAYYEPWFATAYAEFDPDRAAALLDDMGLADRNGDGLREFPDGTPLTITLEYIDFETPKSLTMELVRSYWRDLGIDLRLKLVGVNVQWSRAEAGQMEMSLWHADRASDVMFPLQPIWWAPLALEWTNTMWSAWARWHVTDGRMGEEPPPEIRQLQRWGVEMRTTMSQARRIELGRKILAANAENLWTIGTIGLAPQPVVVGRRLKNVPERAAWGWDNRWTLPYHPETWYFGEPAQ